MGTNFTRNYDDQYTEIVESLHNKTLIVSTILVSAVTLCRLRTLFLTEAKKILLLEDKKFKLFPSTHSFNQRYNLPFQQH
jgi:hypothetical protein